MYYDVFVPILNRIKAITGIVIAPSLRKEEVMIPEVARRAAKSTRSMNIETGLSKKVQAKEMTLSFH